MKKIVVVSMAVFLFTGACLQADVPSHRLGVGAHYWRTIDRIKQDDYKFDDSGLAWLVTYQYAPLSLLKIQADLEIFPEGFGGFDKVTYAPQAYVVVGAGIYAACGIGIHYSDGKFGDDPFYAVRAGLDIEALPSLRLDINVNYRFLDWNNVKKLDDNINTDTVTIGAAVRLEF